MLFCSLGGHKHKHLSAFELCRLFDDRILREGFLGSLHDAETDFGMSHFTASESDRNLELVAAFEEFLGVVDLGFKIVGVDIERKPDFFGLDDLLIFAGFLLFFCLFKSELAVIHDLAHGRGRLRRDLNKVEIALLRNLKGFGGGHDPYLLAFIRNDSDLFVTDFFIDLLFLLADANAPPKVIQKRGSQHSAPHKINALRL